MDDKEEMQQAIARLFPGYRIVFGFEHMRGKYRGKTGIIIYQDGNPNSLGVAFSFIGAKRIIRKLMKP